MRYVLTVDLVDDPAAIAAYEAHHRAVWPEVLTSLRSIGVLEMDIHRLGRRLVMILDVPEGFSRARDFARHAASSARCAEWEALMKTFQIAPPAAPPDEVWALMRPVFSLGQAEGALGP